MLRKTGFIFGQVLIPVVRGKIILSIDRNPRLAELEWVRFGGVVE